MKNTLCILSLLFLISCVSEKGETEEATLGGDTNDAQVTDKRIFQQPFEMPSGEIIEFVECDSHNKVCTINVSIISDDGNALNDALCETDAVSNTGDGYDGNILRVWDLYGNDPVCDYVFSTHKFNIATHKPNARVHKFSYEVVECQSSDHAFFTCGSEEHPFDLIITPTF